MQFGVCRKLEIHELADLFLAQRMSGDAIVNGCEAGWFVIQTSTMQAPVCWLHSPLP